QRDPHHRRSHFFLRAPALADSDRRFSSGGDNSSSARCLVQAGTVRLSRMTTPLPLATCPCSTNFSPVAGSPHQAHSSIAPTVCSSDRVRSHEAITVCIIRRVPIPAALLLSVLELALLLLVGSPVLDVVPAHQCPSRAASIPHIIPT